MKQVNYYFSHDGDAFHDRKIIAMRTKYGVAGYGLYWYIIEQMRMETGYKLPINDEYLLPSIRKEIPEICIEEYLSDCVNIGLFVKDDEYIWSESFLERMEIMEQKLNRNRTNGRLGGRPSKQTKNATKNPKKTEWFSNQNPEITDRFKNQNPNVTQNNQKKRKEKKLNVVVINNNNNEDVGVVVDSPSIIPPIYDTDEAKKLIGTWTRCKSISPTNAEIDTLLDLSKMYGHDETRQAIQKAMENKGVNFTIAYVRGILNNQKNGTSKEKTNGTYTGFNQEEYERSAKEYQELINAKRAAQRN